MTWLRRWIGRIPGIVDLLLHGPTVFPEPTIVPALVSHTHVWDRCRYNGQYWYARCVAFEWCTARIAC